MNSFKITERKWLCQHGTPFPAQHRMLSIIYYKTNKIGHRTYSNNLTEEQGIERVDRPIGSCPKGSKHHIGPFGSVVLQNPGHVSRYDFFLILFMKPSLVKRKERNINLQECCCQRTKANSSPPLPPPCHFSAGRIKRRGGGD